VVPSKLVLGLVVAVGFGAAAQAQVKVTNPGFGPQETFSYEETVGSVTRAYETSLTLVGDGPAARYEYKTADADLEATYRLDPVTLVSLSSETVTRAADAEVHRTAEYRNLKPKAGAGELVVTDLGSLPVVLRGFPWGDGASAKLAFLGATTGGSSVTFVFAVTGKEKVTAAGKTWDCWHATLGLDGALSFLVGKTEYWFAASGDHPLVKVVGPSGGPGSPIRTLVLKSWVSTGSP
jgi:hypothetical protein